LLVRHSLVYIIGRLVPGLVGVLTTAVLTRLLSPSEYGRYGLALAVMNFAATMLFDWLCVAFLRFSHGRRYDGRMIGTIVHIYLVLVGATALLAVVAWGCGLVAGAETSIFGAGLLMSWCYAWFELAARFEIADFRPRRYLAMNLARAALILGGTTAAARLSGNATWTAFAAAACMLAAGFTGHARSWRIGRGGFDPASARMVLGFGAPIAASLAMSSLIFSGTRGLIALLGGARELGYYTAAFVLIQNAMTAVAGGIVSAGYSLAVRALETGDPALVRAQLEANGTLLMAVLAPIALGISLTAPGMTHLFLGANFAPHVCRIAPWMAAGTFLWCVRAHHLDHAFQLGRRPALQVRVTGLAAALSLGLSAWLIPWQGAAGVAMAITAAMAVACVHAWLEGLRAFPIPVPTGAMIRVGWACAAMAAAVCATASATRLGFAVQFAAGGATYALAGVAANLLGSRDALTSRVRTSIAAAVKRE
jgi:O-antigen/teichoic acid export membrane protein